jgi:hypothetical protein
MDHWKTAKKVIRYIYGTKDYKLTYRHTNHLEVIGYLYSGFAGYVDTRKFTSGYIFLLGRGVVSWRSTKQTIVHSSTMKVEFIAYYEATI